MIQQIIALVIILFFVSRLFWQKKNKEIGGNEFIFWLVFWILAALLIIFLKQVDSFVAALGFSGKGIDVLFYLSVVVLFYLVFKLGLKMEKIEKDITKIVRKISLNDKEDKN
ncbi:MAG: DUF2304 family protein [Patescibacteria group bacterium]